MKIVLVAQNSSYTHTNLAVRIFYSLLSEKHEVYIHEITINDKGGTLSLLENLALYEADIYAFSVYIWNREQQISAANGIKKLMPECKIIFGGPEVSFENDDFLQKYPFIDFLIRGEGEQAIMDICDGKIQSPAVVNGGVYKGFEALKEPYFSAKNSYSHSDGRLLYYESSRGCPYNCSYCLSSVKNGEKTVRFKPENVVLEEIAVLMSRDIKTIKFTDRTFNADKKRAKNLFKGILELSKKYMSGEKYEGTTCHFEICAALIDEETIDILSKAPYGLFRFEIGVQTITTKTLAAIGRNNDTQKILENVRSLRENTPVILHLDLISGLPEDTYEGIKKSFNTIYGKADCIQLGILKLLPGTRMLKEAEKYAIEYLSEPPYTVLKTSTIGFSSLRKLERIADIQEKFSENEGNFCKSISYLIKFFQTPFDFYESFSEYFHNKENLQSKKIYAELLMFAKEKGILKTQEISILKEYLRYDFLISNQGKTPPEIERRYTDEERIYLDSQRIQYIHSFPKNQADIFIPATEFHIFGFDNDNIYIIDRKNKFCKQKTSLNLYNLHNITENNCAKDKF